MLQSYFYVSQEVLIKHVVFNSSVMRWETVHILHILLDLNVLLFRLDLLIWLKNNRHATTLKMQGPWPLVCN